MVVIDCLFNEWDAFGDIAHRLRNFLAGKGHVQLIRAEDILMELEQKGASTFSTRLIDQRRERLKELEAVEARTRLSEGPAFRPS